MKTRTVEKSLRDDLSVVSFEYEKSGYLDTAPPQSDCYSICYVIEGPERFSERSRAPKETFFRANFIDKKPSSAVFENDILTLSNGMNLVFFTASELGAYKFRLECTAIKNAENCNIWYFKGNDESGYSFMEIDGVNNRHDPQPNTRHVFTFAVYLEKGQCLVIGIGNYWGAVLKIHSFTAAKINSDSNQSYVFPEDSHFSIFDHPHAAASTHLEKSGDGFLCRPEELHPLCANRGGGWCFFRMYFKGRDAEKLITKSFPELRNGIFSYGFSHKLREIIPMFFVGDEPMNDNLALLIFNDILSFHRSARSIRVNPYVDQSKAKILDNLDKPLRVSDLATELHISDRYLYNLFIEFEGVSPKQFITDARISKAKKLLSNRDMLITEIASAVGFPDVLTFSRFFSGRVGVSPSKFRKKLEKG